MLTHFTKYRKKLPFIPTLVIFATAIILYRIFKNPELDRHIGKVMGVSANDS